MGMIGNQLAAGVGSIAIANDSFNGNGSTTVFTLSQTVSAVTDIEVLVDNVQQSPYDSSYSVSGTTLTFSAAPAAGTNNIYVIYNHARTITTNQVVPDDGSVVEAKLGAAAVTTAKLHDNAVTHGKLPDGCVLQVVQGTALGSVTSSSNAWITTGVDVFITPKFASSKILLTATGCYDTEAGGRQMYSTFYRDSTRLDSIYISGSYGLSSMWNASARQISNVNISLLDTPNTTSQINYKLMFRSYDSNTVEFMSQNIGGVIIAQEIAQ